MPGQIIITEWMYNPTLMTSSEFVEVTNVGGEAVNMVGYSFDDDSRTPGTLSLAGMGTLGPGESGLIIESRAAAFGTEWGLAAAVKIADSNTANLGRGDEINIFNGTTLVDRLTYGDLAFPGHDPNPRQVGRSQLLPGPRRQQRRGVGLVNRRRRRGSKASATATSGRPARRRSARAGPSPSSVEVAAAARTPCRANPKRRPAPVPPPPARSPGPVARW